MEITNLENFDNNIIIKLTGRLDLQGVNEIDEEFKALYSNLSGCLFVDMSEVEFLASLGMRMLMMAAKKLHQSGGKVVVIKPQEVVENALRMSGLDQVIAIVDDIESGKSLL